MGGAFLGAMDMKISQSDAFFDALSSRQVKMRLYRVKMMSYNEKSKNVVCFLLFFFDGPGNFVNFRARILKFLECMNEFRYFSKFDILLDYSKFQAFDNSQFYRLFICTFDTHKAHRDQVLVLSH